jgi:hypothetical protein
MAIRVPPVRRLRFGPDIRGCSIESRRNARVGTGTCDLSSAGAGALAALGLARQARVRVDRHHRRWHAATGPCLLRLPAFDSSTMVRLRARHRRQGVIASQEALGATVSPQCGHRRSDSSAGGPDARSSIAARITHCLAKPDRQTSSPRTGGLPGCACADDRRYLDARPTRTTP